MHQTPTAAATDPRVESWIASIAQSQYYSRPNDEKYSDLDTLRAVCLADKATCRTARVPAGSLRIEPHGGTSIALVGSNGTPAIPTHYAFRSLCSLVGAPGQYLSTLPNTIASDALNFSFGKMEEKTRRQMHQLYLSTPDGQPAGQTSPASWRLRAITSDDYTRVYDAAVAELACSMRDRYGLDLPLTWNKDADGNHTHGGAYRSDRDSFILLTSGGSIVTDPGLASQGGTDARMFRGVILRNSETGNATLSFTCFLYRVVCGNHAIWSPQGIQHFNRRHVGKHFVADFARAVDRARAWLDSPESTDAAKIERMINARLATTQEETIAQIQKLAKTISATQAEQAIRLAEQNEPGDPYSAWNVVQGLTRLSQTSGFMDARHAIDLAAAKITQRYAIAH